MAEKNVVINNRLNNNKFAQQKISSIMMNLNLLVPQTSKLMLINLDRYGQVSDVSNAIGHSKDFKHSFRVIGEMFPTFPFMVASQLKSQPNFLEIGQQLQISAIGSVVNSYSEQKKHLTSFINKLDPKIEIFNSHTPGERNNDVGYLPKLVHGDLHLIIKGLQFKPSAQRNEIIEHYYTFLGIGYLFLRYYFDLLCTVDGDIGAQHIDDIFLNFFTSLYFQEEKYWMGYSNHEKLKVQLKSIIENDNSATRHPILRKAVFDQVRALMPIIHDGSGRKISISMKKVLQKQLEHFRGLSLKKISLFLRALVNCKEINYSAYLVNQLAQGNPGKFHKLHEFLNSEEGESFKIPELDRVMAPMVSKVSDGAKKTIFHDEQTERLKKAQTQLQERSAIASFTQEHLRNYFDSYLERLYARVRKEGALTQNNIADYLAKFAKRAMEIARKEVITREEKQVFEEAATQTFMALGGGQMPHDQMEDFKIGIQEEMEDFENVSVEERIQKVETIGNVMSAAAEMVDNQNAASEQERIYKEAMAIELKVDEDPRHIISVEKFLEQPIIQKDKIQYLFSHTPNPIPTDVYKVIEQVQFRCSRSSSNPVTIYKDNLLQKRSLIRLLFPKHPFKELLQKEIIPILPEKDRPKISVRDFFTFPFAKSRKGPEEDKWFDQHFYYLKMVCENGEMDEGDHQVLLENQENFPNLAYKKYFNIMRKKNFEDTAFMAVYGLWQNNGLNNLRMDNEK